MQSKNVSDRKSVQIDSETMLRLMEQAEKEAADACSPKCECESGDGTVCAARAKRRRELLAGYRETARMILSGETSDPAEFSNMELLVVLNASAKQTGRESPKQRRLAMLLQNNSKRGRRLALAWLRGAMTFEQVMAQCDGVR